MLSETKILPEKFSRVKTSDLSDVLSLIIEVRRFFLVLPVVFFKLWHAWRSSGFTWWLVRDNALQTLFSRTLSPIDTGTGFISSGSWWWYWALLTAFLSHWTIYSVSKQLRFLLTVSSELRISYCLRKWSKRLVRSDNLEDMSPTLINSSINSSFERFSSWLLVRTIIIYEYRWYKIKIRLN